MNQRLAQEAPLPSSSVPLESKDFRYTPVLTKQSAMFNAWKLLCDIAERRGVPIRLAAMYAESEIQGGNLKVDKIKRFNAISLQHLMHKIQGLEDATPTV
jgi:hypothetical protein